MSGSNYFTGSNIATPTKFSTAGLPTTMGNSGGGTIGTVSQSSGAPVIGLFYVIINTVTTTFTASYYDRTDTLQAMTGTVGTPFTFNGVSFTVTAAGAPFVQNDGFLINLSEIGQNSGLNARQITGLSINVQQFQASATPPLDWGAAINALFIYCGKNADVIGVIPPGFYRCDDLTSSTNYQLVVQSNMTIHAYGAVIGTSKTTSGNYGFVGVADPTMPAATSNVTIRGGTWGSTGLNGVLCTDNSALYGGSRTGKIFGLFVSQLTLSDVTVRGFGGELAYTLFGDHLNLDNCAFWNSDGTTGAGGIRVLSGSNILITNTQGRSGDDALQFTPISDPRTTPQSGDITDAYFIGGNVYSISARAIIAGISNPTATYAVTASVKRVGLTCGSSPTSTSIRQIINHNSKGIVQDVTISSVKFVIDPTSAIAYAFLVDGGGSIGGSTTVHTGGVDGVTFTDVSITGAPNAAMVVSGSYISTRPTLTTFTTNVTFINSKFFAPTNVAPTVWVQQCAGFVFLGCEFYANGTYALELGQLGGAPLPASNGIVEDSRFFTSTTSGAQPPAILINNGDMNAIQGWSSFFLGTTPDRTLAAGTGQAVSIHSGVTNTYLDCLDLRGLGSTATTIADAGTGTVIGPNILQPLNTPLVTAPMFATIPAYTKSRFNPTTSGSTLTWPAGSTIIEFYNSPPPPLPTGVIVTLPTPQRDGEIRILASATQTFTVASGGSTANLILTGSTISGLGTTIAPTTALRMVWDATGGYWLQI